MPRVREINGKTKIVYCLKIKTKTIKEIIVIARFFVLKIEEIPFIIRVRGKIYNAENG